MVPEASTNKFCAEKLVRSVTTLPSAPMRTRRLAAMSAKIRLPLGSNASEYGAPSCAFVAARPSPLHPVREESPVPAKVEMTPVERVILRIVALPASAT